MVPQKHQIGVYCEVSPLKALFHSILSASDRTQLASDLVSDLRSEAPFHSKQIRRMRDPGLLWS